MAAAGVFQLEKINLWQLLVSGPPSSGLLNIALLKIGSWKRKGWGTQFEGNLFIYRLSSTTAVWFPQILLCYPHFPLCARFWILFQYLCTFVFVFCVSTNFPLYLVPITDSVSLFPLFLLFLQIAPFVSISLFLAPLIASAAALFNGFASLYSASWRVRSPTFQLQ